MAHSVVNQTCNYAPANTYGHECGAPAVFTAIQRSDRTADGMYFGARCAHCAAIKGGENSRVIRLVPRDESKHINLWR